MIEKLIDEINIQDEITSLLEYELKINNKKINKEKLSREEYIFDTYSIKPSTLYRILRRRLNEK